MTSPEPQSTFTVEGNRLTLLDTGPGRLDTLLRLIGEARQSLRLLYYIYAGDGSGDKVREALIAAARRGVAVKLILDGFGTSGFADDTFFEPMRAAGIELCRFDPTFGRRYLLRNHQKIALADAELRGCRIIIGGFNVEDHYFADNRDPENWRDLGLLVEGPAACRLVRYFDAVADWTSRDDATLKQLRAMLRERHEDEGCVRWLLGGPSRRLSPWARTVREAIARATRVDIIAAYFTPSPGMLRRLDRAARRQATRARVITAAHSDSNIAIAAARFTYAGLLRKGVRVFEYQPCKLHTKLYVIDDAVFIGSANFDMRSLFINMEIMLRVQDAGFAEHMRRYVEGELTQCREVTGDEYRKTGWLQRLRQFAAYAVIGVLDPRLSRGLNFGIE